MRALIRTLVLSERAASVKHAIDRTLHTFPREALLALSDSKAPGSSIPSLLIKSGVAWANLAAAHNDDAPEWSVRGALAAALLSAADGEWSTDEIDAATGVCGSVVAEVLTGKDPFANFGKLDAASEIFAREPTLRDEFVRQMALVPQGILSGDARVIASMELVRERQDPRLGWLLVNARRIVEEVSRLVRFIGDPTTESALEARRQPDATSGWRVVPFLSLACALLARHAARGNDRAASGTYDSRVGGQIWGRRARPCDDRPDPRRVTHCQHNSQQRIAHHMTQNIDAVATSTEIKAAYRRYLQSLLAVRDPALDAALRHAIDTTPMLDKGPVPRSDSPVRARQHRRGN